MWGAGSELREERGGMRSRQSSRGLVVRQLVSVVLKPCTVTVVPGGKRPKEKRVSTAAGGWMRVVGGEVA